MRESWVIISCGVESDANFSVQLRAFLAANNLPDTQIFAKIENIEVSKRF